MEFLLAVIIEYLTMYISDVVMTKISENTLIAIPKKGFKIEHSILEQYFSEVTKREKSSTLKNVISIFIKLIPGINILYAYLKGEKIKREFLKSKLIQVNLVPLTDQEKNEFAMCLTPKEKLTFLAFSFTRNEDEMLVGFINETPIVVDFLLAFLNFDQLLPLGYTLDEVKKLNEATGKHYYIGRTEGRNIAIIGIPGQGAQEIKRIRIKGEDVDYNFSHMTEEEAQDKRFVVYPYTNDKEEEVNKAVEDIRRARQEKKNAEAEVEVPNIEQIAKPHQLKLVNNHYSNH